MAVETVPVELWYTLGGFSALGFYEVVLRPYGRQVKDAGYTNPPEQSNENN